MKRNPYSVVIRIEMLKKRFLDGGALSCRDIAAQFDTSPKTAQRDIDFLRSYYGLTIDYDAKTRALYLAAPAPKCPPTLAVENPVIVPGRYPKKRKTSPPIPT